jgi:hypothetical protein
VLLSDHFEVFLEGNDSLESLVRLHKQVVMVEFVVIDVVDVCFVNRMQEYLLDCEAPHQRHQPDLGSYPHDLVLERYLPESFHFVHFLHFLLLTVGYPVLARRLFDLLELSSNQRIQKKLGAVLRAIQGAQREDQEFQENLHLVFVLDHEINISSSKLKCNAIPRMERKLLQLLLAH